MSLVAVPIGVRPRLPQVQAAPRRTSAKPRPPEGIPDIAGLGAPAFRPEGEGLRRAAGDTTFPLQTTKGERSPSPLPVKMLQPAY